MCGLSHRDSSGRFVHFFAVLFRCLRIQAKAAHDLWARDQLDRGWTFGPTYDPLRKTNNRLVPYRHLHNKEKRETRADVIQILKGMVWLGFAFRKRTSTELALDLESPSNSSESSTGDRYSSHSRILKRTESVDDLGHYQVDGDVILSPHRSLHSMGHQPLIHRESSGGTKTLNIDKHHHDAHAHVARHRHVPSHHSSDGDGSDSIMELLKSLSQEVAAIRASQEKLEQRISDM